MFWLLFFPSPPRETFSDNVNYYLFLPEHGMVIFLFHFLFQWQNLVFGHKASSLQESHQAEHIQLKWKIAVLQFSVTSTLWMQDSLCVFHGQLPTPFHTLFIHLLATTEMVGTCIQKSCHWDDFWIPRQEHATFLNLVPFGSLHGKDYTDISYRNNFPSTITIGPPLKFLLFLLVTQ